MAPKGFLEVLLSRISGHRLQVLSLGLGFSGFLALLRFWFTVFTVYGFPVF